jgi:hypothetical protein
MSGDIVDRLRADARIWRAPHLSEAADEIERLRKVEDQLAKARLKIEQQANRIDELEAELALLREALKPIKRP